MNNIIIGYEKDQTVKSAVLVGMGASENDLGNDVLDMLKSGLTVNIVDAGKIIVGEKIDWSEVKITRL